MLTPNKYQTESFKTLIDDGILEFLEAPHDENLNAEEARDEHLKQREFARLLYSTLALNGEAGEFGEEIKKTLREGGDITARREKAIDELGDVLWYLSACATLLNISLEDLMEKNLGKVRAKHKKAMAEKYGK